MIRSSRAHPRTRWLLILAAALVIPGVARGSEEGPMEPLPEVASLVDGLERRAGLLTFHVDSQRGRVLLEMPRAAVPAEGIRLLYVEGLVAGLGSNPVGLDRGQIGPSRLVALRRVGGRLLVEEINLRFRARSDDPSERLAVRQSFARSVLWGGELLAEDGDGRFLVDFTSFIVRDAHGTLATLKQTEQGSFSLDEGRSAVDLDACLAFPENVELQALLTFTGSEPGPHVRETVPITGGEFEECEGSIFGRVGPACRFQAYKGCAVLLVRINHQGRGRLGHTVPIQKSTLLRIVKVNLSDREVLGQERTDLRLRKDLALKGLTGQ